MEFKYDHASIPHRRFNPLLRSWLLISPHRLQRPWQGQQEEVTKVTKETEDLSNPLRPRSVRASGETTPDYKSIFMFRNDFPALLKDPRNRKALANEEDDELFQIQDAIGDCFVICYDPRSTVTLASMAVHEVVNVIKKWIDVIMEEGSKYNWVQIFENKGEMMGCSNTHPHCQVWSTNYVPQIPNQKDKSQLDYFQRHQSPMLYDYVMEELNKQIRVVLSNDAWVCVIPFWAEWPFETMLIPRRKGVVRLTDLNETEVQYLATIMQQLLHKYNNLFKTQFPYSMGWHGAPTGQFLTTDMSYWTLHASYFPPLLRSATVRKYFVGFELLAESQRDLTPEIAAEMLRNSKES